MVNGKWKKKIRSSIYHLPFTIYHLLFQRSAQIEGAVVVVILEAVVAECDHLAQAAGEDAKLIMVDDVLGNADEGDSVRLCPDGEIVVRQETVLDHDVRGSNGSRRSDDAAVRDRIIL